MSLSDHHVVSMVSVMVARDSLAKQCRGPLESSWSSQSEYIVFMIKSYRTLYVLNRNYYFSTLSSTPILHCVPNTLAAPG